MKLKYFFSILNKEFQFQESQNWKNQHSITIESTCTFISPEEKDHKIKFITKH